MKLIFLGPPGVGKGSIAKELMKLKGLLQISTGDLLRAIAKENSELGSKVKECLGEGNFVPDELIIELLKQRISQEDCERGFILDGFPRNLAQADSLSKELNIDKVLSFNVGEDTILERLSGRRVCKGCGAIYHMINILPKFEGICDCCGKGLFQRDDDKEEVIKKRLEIYKEQTEPLIKYYKEKGILSEVEVEGDLVKNVEDTLRVLEKIN